MTADHDPLTCTKCSPAPTAFFEVTSRGRTRRFTNGAALALCFGPVALVGFLAGLIIGLSVAR